MSISKHLKTAAFCLYIDGRTAGEIAKILDINLHTVKYWVDKGSADEKPWKLCRDLAADLVHDVRARPPGEEVPRTLSEIAGVAQSESETRDLELEPEPPAQHPFFNK